MKRTIRAAKFLVKGPVILLFLVIVNAMTSPGDWWVQWAALGIGIAWVLCLIRVLTAALMLGGVAAGVTALIAYLRRRQNL